MIPIHLTMEAFGPYVEKQIVDFTRFQNAGLFLIYGKTGSGKTTILDAITYALFGKSSGGTTGDGRGDITTMRSDFAGEEQLTVVEFEFELRQRRYKFVRSVAVHTKRSGEKEYRKTQTAFYADENGNFAPFFENPTLSRVNDKAVELLGLSYDQFCQVIILPQGKFERLLVAGTEEKENILSTLFRAEQWQRISDRLCEMAIAKKRETEQMENTISSALAQYACENMEQLKEQLAEKKTLVKKLRKEAEAEAVQEATAQQRFLHAEKQEARFKEMEAAQKEQEVLLSMKEEYAQMAQRILRAADAQKVLPFRSNAARMQEVAQRRDKEQLQLQVSVKNLEKQLSDLVSRLHGHLQYLHKNKQSLQQTKMNMEKQERLARERYQLIFENYISNIAYELSGELVEGEPCPVCGNTNHVKKAEKHEKGASAQDVKLAEQQVSKNATDLRKAETELLLLEHEIVDCETSVAQIQLLAERKILPAKEDKATLLDAIRTATQQKVATEALKSKAEAEHAEAVAQFQHAMEEYKAECCKYQFEDDAQVKQCSLTEEQVAELKMRLEQYEAKKQAALTRLETLGRELQGVQRPDVQAGKTELDAATTRRRQAETTFTQQNTVADMMEKASQIVEKQTEKLEKQRGEFVDLDGFAKLLRGDMGIGLKRYVLGVMLSSVAHEANRMLKLVHGGRYQLFRTSEGTGRARKVGLELEVFDSNTGEKRGVSGLSGGEKFLVSLSLSLGLSAVVQAQSGGIRMDAIFIDEGFGTLDPNSIEDAMAVLSSIRGGSRLVGIISHVGILRENIEASIEVEKTRRGSKLRMHT